MTGRLHPELKLGAVLVAIALFIVAFWVPKHGLIPETIDAALADA